MTNEELKQLIGSWFTDHNAVHLVFEDENTQFLNISIHPDYLHELMWSLKHNAQTSLDYLFCLTGVDWGKDLGVVYHLESTRHRHILVVRANAENPIDPCLDSVQDIWATANFHEREVFDFFGIKFNNHPNLKRLFLTEDWQGFPLRKDYVDEANMVIK